MEMDARQKREPVRVHRLGTVTAGLMLVVFGVLFLVHMFVRDVSYRFILQLWPLILICLGVELLISQTQKQRKLVYDKGALFVMILMVTFSMGMAFVNMMLEYEWLYRCLW